MNTDLTESQDYDIRYSRLTDITYLKSWVIDPRVMSFLPFDYTQSQEIENFCKNFIGFSKYNACLTATYKMKPIGIGVLYLMPYKKVSHLAMIQMIVDPIWQKKGVGFSLLKNLKHQALSYFKLDSIHCELMADHPAMNLLKKNNFYEVYRQDGFYKIDQNYKARVVMECKL